MAKSNWVDANLNEAGIIVRFGIFIDFSVSKFALPKLFVFIILWIEGDSASLDTKIPIHFQLIKGKFGSLNAVSLLTIELQRGHASTSDNLCVFLDRIWIWICSYPAKAIVCLLIFVRIKSVPLLLKLILAVSFIHFGCVLFSKC